jgi:hypothetical protein
MPFRVCLHDKKHRCQAHACRNKKAGRAKLCHRHLRILEKERDPVRYAYRVTRQNAKRRGKDWSITYEEWAEFCSRTQYLENKGRGPNSASLDRIDPAKGYSLDNLRILSLSENSRKGATTDKAPF